jgi:hypothetical protein
MAHPAGRRPWRGAMLNGEMRLPIRRDAMHEKSPRRGQTRLLLSLPLLMLPLLTGCASNRQPAESVVIVPKAPANPYRYIKWSKHDTRKTIDAIRRHNALHARMKAKVSERKK